MTDMLRAPEGQQGDLGQSQAMQSVPKGIRTPVTAVKGRCPRPLDDGDCSDRDGGGKRDRTADLLHAMQALSQLSYTPTREARIIAAGRASTETSLRSPRRPRRSVRLGVVDHSLEIDHDGCLIADYPRVVP